jgi:hypothetical protein
MAVGPFVSCAPPNGRHLGPSDRRFQPRRSARRRISTPERAGGRAEAEEGKMASEVMPARHYRTQVWMTAEGGLPDLVDRTNSALASIEGAGGRIERIEVVPTPVSANTLLYTAVVIYQERLLVEEED